MRGVFGGRTMIMLMMDEGERFEKDGNGIGN